LCQSIDHQPINENHWKINENHKLLYKVTNISIGRLVCPLVSSKLGKITKSMKINENQHNQVVNISIKSQTTVKSYVYWYVSISVYHWSKSMKIKAIKSWKCIVGLIGLVKLEEYAGQLVEKQGKVGQWCATSLIFVDFHWFLRMLLCCFYIHAKFANALGINRQTNTASFRDVCDFMLWLACIDFVDFQWIS